MNLVADMVRKISGHINRSRDSNTRITIFEPTLHFFFKRLSILAENMCFASLHYEVDVGGGLLEPPSPESTENGAV